MDPEFRQLFNTQFTPELYASYVRQLSRRLDSNFEFRLAETPVFLPVDFKRRVTSAARDIVEQLSDRKNLDRMRKAIPDR